MLLALAAGCRGDRDTIHVRLDGPFAEEHDPTEPPLSARSEPLRFAFASVLSPERSATVYARLGEYLAGVLGRPVQVVRRKTYAELNDLLESGGADAGLICSGSFSIGMVEFGLRPLVMPEINGSLVYYSYVVARHDSEYRSLEDMKGATFAFSDPLSNTGYRYVTQRLHDAGTTPREFFGETFFTYSHDNSVEAVRDGIADAGSIDSLVWDELVRRDPSILSELRVVERSPAFPINPVAVSPLFPRDAAAALKEAFLQMNEDAAARSLMEELGVDRWVEPSAQAILGFEKIAASWRQLGVISATATIPQE